MKFDWTRNCLKFASFGYWNFLLVDELLFFLRSMFTLGFSYSRINQTSCYPILFPRFQHVADRESRLGIKYDAWWQIYLHCAVLVFFEKVYLMDHGIALFVAFCRSGNFTYIVIFQRKPWLSHRLHHPVKCGCASGTHTATKKMHRMKVINAYCSTILGPCVKQTFVSARFLDRVWNKCFESTAAHKRSSRFKNICFIYLYSRQLCFFICPWI